MVILVITLIITAVVLLFVVFSGTNEIKEINDLINKDRSVCDFINALSDYGWSIDTFNTKGIRLVIFSELGGTYYLYLSYNGGMPPKDKLQQLHRAMTCKESPITEAHKIGVPYDKYVIMKSIADDAKYATGRNF